MVCPHIFIAGLVFSTVLFVRSEILDLRDIRKLLILFFARIFFYSGFVFACISILPQIGALTSTQKIGYSIVLAIILISLPVLDRRLRNLVNQGFESPDFRTAQSAISAFIEQAHATSNLHANFVDILRHWSGSPVIFLSDATHAAPWPVEPIPTALLTHVFEHKWTTPEILDRLSSIPPDTLSYVVDHHVAAIVCYTGRSGERIVAAFKTRNSRKTFLSQSYVKLMSFCRRCNLGSHLCA